MDDTKAVAEFCEWLKQNGATFPKISWPSLINEDGIRGGIAVETIETNEIMMSIPIKLLMSPECAFADPVVGEIFKKHRILLQGDVLLAVYIMYECSKGADSFYYPFIKTLPQPESITTWDYDMLLKFEEDPIPIKVRQRRNFLQRVYHRFVLHVCEQHPEHFPREVFTYDLFLFAWNSIQARAFGKRLPWTAMVPFADCLNHNNVQTKYDYNVDGNALFRMYPSGTNRYTKGSEVFNSYGRRPNLNLLIDFGFALLDNEWDCIEIVAGLCSRDQRATIGTEEETAVTAATDSCTSPSTPPSATNSGKRQQHAGDGLLDPLADLKKKLLRQRGLLTSNVFYIYRSVLPFKLLNFFRVANLSENDAAAIVKAQQLQEAEEAAAEASAAGANNSSRSNTNSRSSSSSSSSIISLSNETIALQHCIHVLTSILDGQDLHNLSSEYGRFTTISCTNHYSSSLRTDEAALQRINELLRRRNNNDAAPGTNTDKSEYTPVPSAPASLASLAASVLYEASTAGELMQHKWVLTYRVTKKRVIQATIQRLRVVLEYCTHILQEGQGLGQGQGQGPNTAAAAAAKTVRCAATELGSVAEADREPGPEQHSTDLVDLVRLTVKLNNVDIGEKGSVDSSARKKAAAAAETPPPAVAATGADSLRSQHNPTTHAPLPPPTVEKSKTDSYHIIDYDGSFANSEAALNMYLKEVCAVSRAYSSSSGV